MRMTPIQPFQGRVFYSCEPKVARQARNLGLEASIPLGLVVRNPGTHLVNYGDCPPQTCGAGRVREGYRKEIVSFIVAQPELPLNPMGIESFSLGLARVREGLPKVAAGKNSNPERVESPCL